MTRETFAVALVGEEHCGWLVDPESAGEARRIVHGTLPRAHEVWESELLVWLASDYQARHLAGAACGRGYLVDPGGADAGADPVRALRTHGGTDLRSLLRE